MDYSRPSAPRDPVAPVPSFLSAPSLPDAVAQRRPILPFLSSADRDRPAQLLSGWRRERCRAAAGVGQVGVLEILVPGMWERPWLASYAAPEAAAVAHDSAACLLRSRAMRRVRRRHGHRRATPLPAQLAALSAIDGAAQSSGGARSQDAVLSERVGIGV